jgi:hypothetical protein
MVLGPCFVVLFVCSIKFTIFLHNTWILEFKNYVVMVTCGLHRYVNLLILYHVVVGIGIRHL